MRTLIFISILGTYSIAKDTSSSESDSSEHSASRLSYDDTLWVRMMQHSAYSSYLKAWRNNRQRFVLYKFAQGLTTTPYPLLKVPFLEPNSEAHVNSSYVSMNQIFSRPETIDDEIGMPLPYNPVNKEKISFWHYPYMYSYYTQG